MRPGSARCRLTCRLAVPTVAGRGLAEPGICGRWLPVWAPRDLVSGANVRMPTA